MSAAADSYRLRKQRFFEGLDGTSHWEVFMLSQSMPMLLCLGNSLRLWLGIKWIPHRSFRQFLLEAVAVLLPTVALSMSLLPLTLTFWTLAAAYFGTVLLPLLLLATGQYRALGVPGALSHQQAAGALNLGAPRKEYVTASRGVLMLYTCICILAVDFRAFPRHWAKAEAYGAGLMDVGVGALILCSGMAASGRRSPAAGPGASSRGGWGPGPLLLRAGHGLRAAFACVVLGAVRIVSVKLLGYQEHIGEYGAHWNFFCTIAVVTLLSHMLPAPPPWLAPAVATAHQLLLSHAGLGAWSMSPDRGSDLWSLNKEGLVSCPGYWALYLVGGALAAALQGSCQEAVQGLRAALGPVPAANVSKERGAGGKLQGQGDMALQERSLGTEESGAGGSRGGSGAAAASGLSPGLLSPLLLWLLRWACADAALWGCALAAEASLEPRSRRLCNAPYILWTAALTLSALLTLAAAQVSWTLLLGSSPTPPRPHQADSKTPQLAGDLETTALIHCQPWLPAAANHSMLAVFLVANLLTGGVNLSMDTLAVSDTGARLVVAAYITVVAAVAAGLQTWNLKLG